MEIPEGEPHPSNMPSTDRDGDVTAGMPERGLTHFDHRGNARMVDISQKSVTARTAVAQALVRMDSETMETIRTGRIEKGDVLQVARLAGIMAAKRTDEWIPLCHSMTLASATVDFDFIDERTLRIQTSVSTRHQTGVEMEALVAATAAALTVYDMCKAIDREMTIEQVCLLRKEGGRSGRWVRSDHEST